jgi:hypothetical protein
MTLRKRPSSADHDSVDQSLESSESWIARLLSRRVVKITGYLGASALAFGVGLVVVFSNSTLTSGSTLRGQRPSVPFRTTSLERHSPLGSGAPGPSDGRARQASGLVPRAAAGPGNMASVTFAPSAAPTPSPVPSPDVGAVPSGLSKGLGARHSGRNRLGVRGTGDVRPLHLDFPRSASGMRRGR